MVSANVIAELQPSLLRQARRLTGSQDAAEDLVQETWVRYFEKPPRVRNPLRVLGWLSITMRNLLIDAAG